MSKIIRTEPNKVLSKAVEYHGFVFLQGCTAQDLSKDITGQTEEVLAAIDEILDPWHRQDTFVTGADLVEGHQGSRRDEQTVVRLAARGRRPGPCLRAGEHGRSAPSR